MEYCLPSRLISASTIGIYSPSGAFSDTHQKIALFENGVERLHELGFNVRESSHCRSSWYHASAHPIDRASDLRELISDPDVDIILPSIGGHVAAQLLPLIDVDSIAASGKAFFGFSDNAILPLVTTAKTGVCTFHTLCDVTFGFGRFVDNNYLMTQENFLQAVKKQSFDLSGNRHWQAMQSGNAIGVILGGNLKGLTSLIGTRWWPDWRGKIMFWESADPLHAVVQHLVHMANAGAFKQLSGMIIGRVSTLKENFYRPEQVIPMDSLLLDVLGLRGAFPIVIEADIGHDVDNVTIPLGATVHLSVGDDITCTIKVT